MTEQQNPGVSLMSLVKDLNLSFELIKREQAKVQEYVQILINGVQELSSQLQGAPVEEAPVEEAPVKKALAKKKAAK